jgi:sugar lactone lactonase YvrE
LRLFTPGAGLPRNPASAAVTVSPDGSTVFVTGTNERRHGSFLATVAYSG